MFYEIVSVQKNSIFYKKTLDIYIQSAIIISVKGIEKPKTNGSKVIERIE